MGKCYLNDFFMVAYFNISQLPTIYLVPTSKLIIRNGMSLKIIKNDKGSKF